MTVFVITVGDQKFYTDDTAQVPEGATFVRQEMTESEYFSIPASIESAQFFK